MAIRISSRLQPTLGALQRALVVAVLGGTALLACADEPETTLGQTQQDVGSYWQLPAPLALAPGARHAYALNLDLSDQGPGFGVGEPDDNASGSLGGGAYFLPAFGGSFSPLKTGGALVGSGALWLLPDGQISTYAQFPHQVGQLGTGDFTIMIDYAGNYTGAVADLVSNRDLVQHGNFFNIRMSGNGQVTVEVDQDAYGTNYNFVQGGAINDGLWHRVAAVRQGKQLSLAIDGVVVASRQGPGVADIEAYSSSGSGFNDFLIGARTSDRAPSGMFNNLTVYDRALTAAELAGIAAPSAFQDFTAAPTAWTNVSGAWTWDGSSSLTVAPGTDGAVTWLPGLWASDVAVETQLTLDSSGWAGLLLRGMNWSATNNGGQQYYIAICAGYSNNVIIGKNDNGWTQLGLTNAPITQGTAHVLRVEAIGSEIDLYLDGAATPTLSVTDRSFAAGGIGLKSYYAGATFNYVHVMPDLARGKATTQSATAYGGVSSRAVDGNTDGAFYDGSVTHTNAAAGQWWKVDLGQISAVTDLVVWSRAASDCSVCGSRLQDYDVETSVDGLNWTDTTFATVPQQLVVPINGPVRYVMIGHVSAGYSQFAEPISLAEVAAFGTACGSGQTAGSHGNCTPCPTGLITRDGKSCVKPLPMSPFGGADYVSRLVSVDSGMCMVAENTTTVHSLPCPRHTTSWWLNQVPDASTGGTAYLLRMGNRCLVVDAPGANGTATVHTTSAGCTGASSLWKIGWNAAGQMLFQNEQSNLCLAASGGDVLDARACTGASDELWNPDTLRPRSITTPLAMIGPKLGLQTNNKEAVLPGSIIPGSFCLNIAAGGSTDLETCQLPAPNPAAQNLVLTSLDDGSVLIQGDGGNCLTAPDGASQGASIGATACTGKTEQRWAIVQIDGGGTVVVSLYNGYCVGFAVSGTGSLAGVVPVQQQCSGNIAGVDYQIFYQTRTSSSIPMRVTLVPTDQNGDPAAVVLTSEAGVHVTNDAMVIAGTYVQSGGKQNDLCPPVGSAASPVMNLDQCNALASALAGPSVSGSGSGSTGSLQGSATFTWYPLNPAMSSASGSFSDGYDSGTFILQDGFVSGTLSQQLPIPGFSYTIDWGLGSDGPEMSGFQLNTPLGPGGFSVNDGWSSVVTQGNQSVSFELGTYTVGLSMDSNGYGYSGPGAQYINLPLSYVNSYAVNTVLMNRRMALDVFANARSWGELAYGPAAAWVANVATQLTNDIVSGFQDIASAVTNPGTVVQNGLDTFEHTFGTLGGWLRGVF